MFVRSVRMFCVDVEWQRAEQRAMKTEFEKQNVYHNQVHRGHLFTTAFDA
jgi:hypothetical protein